MDYTRTKEASIITSVVKGNITQAVRKILGNDDASIITVKLSKGSIIGTVTITPKVGSSTNS